MILGLTYACKVEGFLLGFGFVVFFLNHGLWSFWEANVWRLVTVNGGAAAAGCRWVSSAPKSCIASLSNLYVPPWIKISTRHQVGIRIMTRRVPHLYVKLDLKEINEVGEILTLVSFTSLASPACLLSGPALPARSLPLSLSLSLGAVSDVLGLTGLICWWCRCEETTSAGRLLATAPLLRDKRSTDLHTFTAISVVKARREGDCCGRADGEAPKKHRGRGGRVCGAGLWYTHAQCCTSVLR